MCRHFVFPRASPLRRNAPHPQARAMPSCSLDVFSDASDALRWLLLPLPRRLLPSLRPRRLSWRRLRRRRWQSLSRLLSRSKTREGGGGVYWCLPLWGTNATLQTSLCASNSPFDALCEHLLMTMRQSRPMMILSGVWMGSGW
jgi:hypothetical protein